MALKSLALLFYNLFDSIQNRPKTFRIGININNLIICNKRKCFGEEEAEALM